MKELKELSDLRHSLGHAKNELTQIENRLIELFSLQTKLNIQPIKGSDLEDRLQQVRKKEMALGEISKEIGRLNKFKEDVLSKIATLERQIGSINEPALLDEKKQAQKKIQILVVKCCEKLLETHKICEEILELKNAFGGDVQAHIKNKNLYEYWLLNQRKIGRNMFQELCNFVLNQNLVFEE